MENHSHRTERDASKITGRTEYIPSPENPWALSDALDEFTSESINRMDIATDIPRMIGRYEVIRVLGSGGFAVVYLAFDRDLDRQVAIKVPRPDRFTDHGRLSHFVEEARKTAQFDHKGIVRVYDVQRETARVYIVEQFIDGSDLAEFSRSTTLLPSDIADLMIAIAEAVGYAHRRGFVHRDLKPANILMDKVGTPHVADFGLASV